MTFYIKMENLLTLTIPFIAILFSIYNLLLADFMLYDI